MSTLALLVLAGGARASLAAEPSGAVLAAPPAGESRADAHASRAHQLEALGKTLEAAREYEAAFAETRDPEALYHLAICRRDLGDYKAAREALRGYLRVEPDGPLRDEVERQLAQLAVLIEARGLRGPDTATTGAVRKPRPRAKAMAIDTGSPPAQAPLAAPSALLAAPSALLAAPSAPLAAPRATTLSVPLAAIAPAAQAPAAPTPADAPSSPPRALAATTAPDGTHPPGAPDGIVSDEHQAGSVARSTRAAQAPERSVQENEPPPLRERLRPASPWLAGGGVALAATGVALCIGAHQIASDLDARFAAGDLTQADLPRYSKSRAEWIAGTALLGLGAIAAGAALVLAW